VELRERFARLRAYDRQSGDFVTIDLDTCAFGYRDSLFKREGRDRYIITAVTLRLPKAWQPVLNYGELARELEGVHARCGASPRRDRRDPLAQAARSGKDRQRRSFFKNPVVDAALRLPAGHHPRPAIRNPMAATSWPQAG
jgi:UDP-N-acetylmuramate dehydrogenase